MLFRSALYEANEQWISVWFHAIDVELSDAAEHKSNLRAEVHPRYCDYKEGSCFINIKLPLMSQ